MRIVPYAYAKIIRTKPLPDKNRRIIEKYPFFDNAKQSVTDASKQPSPQKSSNRP